MTQFLVGVALWAGLCLSSFPGAASAASFTVNSTADGNDVQPGDGVCASRTGACTLRAAIEETNALAGADTITLPSGFYRLKLGELQVSDGLTITVSGPARAVIDAGFHSRVLAVLSPAVLVASGLGIQHGNRNDCGGGVYNGQGATLTLSESIITHNRVQLSNQDTGGTLCIGDVGGGGLSNYGTASLTDVDVTRNHVGAQGFLGLGGGIANGDTGLAAQLTLNRTRISHNRVTGTFDSYALGGGIANGFCSALNIDDVSVRGNYTRGTTGSGGGLYNIGEITGANLTVDGNGAFAPEEGDDSEGGGIFDESYGPGMTITGLWVTRNHAIGRAAYAAGGGLALWGENAQLTNVYITGNRVVASGSDTGPSGGGVDVEVTSSLTLSAGVISQNVVYESSYGELSGEPPVGGGIAIGAPGATVTLTDLVITFNHAIGLDATAGGLFADPPVTLNNVIFGANVP